MRSLPLDRRRSAAGMVLRRWAGLSFWSRVWIVVIAGANAVLVAITIAGFFVSDVGYDWAIYVEAGQRVLTGELFDWEGTYAWSYSPLLAYVFAAIAPIGYLGWTALHFGTLVALRDRWLALVTLVSWPFWVDVYNGNTLTFVFVAGASAMLGSAVGTGSFLVLSLLMPRPLMLPLVAWIMWRRPEWRWRFAALFAAHAFLVVLTGYGTAWLDVLAGVPDAVGSSSRDIGPSAILGGWWLVVGLPLAAWLTWRGRIGFASLAASPYWLPQYLMMLILELVRPASGATKTSRRIDRSGQ